MWPHRPVGRVMFTLALGLVAAAALLLDTAAPPAADAMVAWHALSTLALAALAGWALWTPQLPRDSGRSLAALLGLAAGQLAVAAGRLPFHAIEGFAMPFVLALARAARWRWSAGAGRDGKSPGDMAHPVPADRPGAGHAQAPLPRRVRATIAPCPASC